MSRVTYKDDVTGVELGGEAKRGGLLQDERADAINSGIVRDLDARHTDALTPGAPALSAIRSSKPRMSVVSNDTYGRGDDYVGSDDDLAGFDETDTGANPRDAQSVRGRSRAADKAMSSEGHSQTGDDGPFEETSAPQRRSIVAMGVDELVYRELDESDELDDAAPVYRDVRQAQRAMKARSKASTQSLNAEGVNPRSKALSSRNPRTKTLGRGGKRAKGRFGARRAAGLGKTSQGARQGAAAAIKAQSAAAGAATASANATTAATMTATAGAAGFPVAGVLGVLLLFIIGVLAIAQIISAIFGFWENEEAKQSLQGLPPYITYEMVEEALACQEEYGHPAGATIAQIICESGMGDTMSALATRDHNLFGMKWASTYAGCPEVSGSASWTTQEEVDGVFVTITARFIKFKGDRECIRFRSRVFLQASRYKDNTLIKEAIATHSSDKMAEGLKAAGWATSSAYVDSLKSVMKAYDLYRFDGMSVETFKAGVASGDAIVAAAYTQLGTPYVWGGTTPNVGLDCSGLTQYCYKQAGISIPRNSEDQHASGRSIPISQAQPGDILWKPGHVAIYVSENTYIHAPHTGDVVRVAQGTNYFSCAVTYRF